MTHKSFCQCARHKGQRHPGKQRQCTICTAWMGISPAASPTDWRGWRSLILKNRKNVKGEGKK